MKMQASTLTDGYDDPLITNEEDKEGDKKDLRFLLRPLEKEPDDLLFGPRAKPRNTDVINDWTLAAGVHDARLARVAGGQEASDDRLLRGPEGWQHRLALIEEAELSWFAGDRVSSDPLTLWVSMRLSGVLDDSAAPARVGLAVRRLIGGPSSKTDSAAFLDRCDPEKIDDSTERLKVRAGG